MLKNAISTVDSPSAPATPRSCLFSSDEEYRTASEGGRRDSEDWGEIPSSPPLPKNAFAKVKDRSRQKTKLPRNQSRQSTLDSVSTDEQKTKLPRNQSRQSTLDSVSTDEIDACKLPDEVEMKNSVNKQTLEMDVLKQQLSCALTEMQNLETQLSRYESPDINIVKFSSISRLPQMQ
ncbi:PH domain [Popillia japonica]